MFVRIVLICFLCCGIYLSNAQQMPGFVTNEVMDDNDFWKIIDKSARNAEGNFEHQKASITKQLKRHDVKDIVRFNNQFFSLMEVANDSKLYAAFKIINPKGSMDDFADFRSCMICLGKDNFLKIMSNPDALALLDVNKQTKFQSLQFCADDAFYYLLSDHIPLGLQLHNTPRGNNISTDRALVESLFPKLILKFKN